MGQHFTNLGEQQQQQQRSAAKPNITPAGPATSPSQPAAASAGAGMPAQGPLAEAAMKKYMENARKATFCATPTPRRILASSLTTRKTTCQILLTEFAAPLRPVVARQWSRSRSVISVLSTLLKLLNMNCERSPCTFFKDRVLRGRERE